METGFADFLTTLLLILVPVALVLWNADWVRKKRCERREWEIEKQLRASEEFYRNRYRQ